MTALLGLISDTHGLLRPQALQALKGADHILHAGDVGKSEVLDALEAVAPVTAVRGNVDRDAWSLTLPLTARRDFGGKRIFMQHILADLDFDPSQAGIAAVITGHTHKPKIETSDGILYINPGSAGPRRFSLPVSIGFLRLDPWEAWIEQLDI